MQPLLKVEELSKTFTLHALNQKHIRALEGVSFELRDGEILGLAGTSGAGKSSLMKCLYRTYIPSGGSIWFRANTSARLDLANASEHVILQLRKTAIRYCSQFLQAIPRVPATEVVAEGLLRQGVDREQALRQAQVVLERLRLPRELWDSYPATFSGGEQQRVNMARALATESKLLLVDEPTASLDAASKSIVIQMIRASRDRGASIILITHDRDTLQQLADRELHLENGRVRELSAA